MKFPYGLFDFRKLITKGYLYCDRTHYLPILEETGDVLLFIRPRRFGKSLLLSMLQNYYDVARQDQFEQMFGHLAVGNNPTPLHNQYFILKWDFSCVDPTGSAEDIKRSLHTHVNACIEAFLSDYEAYLSQSMTIDSDNALHSLSSLLTIVRKTSYPVYLLIDEYDNFANEVMMEMPHGKRTYQALVHKNGPLKTLFKAVKAATEGAGFDKVFITGVSPVVMSDITSGFNIAKNIYLRPVFNTLCGFTEAEIERVLTDIAQTCGFGDDDTQNILALMRTYYNGYKFAVQSKEFVYNPTLVLYFLEAFLQFCCAPRNMLDANLAVDEAKLYYTSQLIGGKEMLVNLLEGQHTITIPDIADRFGIRQMLSPHSKDVRFLASFLYYVGVLTMKAETVQGELALQVPNLVMQRLYVERMREMLLPQPMERDTGVTAAKRLYEAGDIAPLCTFVEQTLFPLLSNRDYRWANELTVKTMFLTLLYNDILYIMDSGPETGRGYADLTMIIRPDMRRFEILDVLIEFKYVTLQEVGLSGEQARALSTEAFHQRAVVQENMAAARDQARRYGGALEQKYGKLRLRRYAVVALGFERLWGEEV